MMSKLCICMGIIALGFAAWMADLGVTFLPAALLCAACGVMMLNMGVRLRDL